MDLSDDSGDEANPGVTVDENELLNSDDEEGGRHVLHNTIDEEELLYEGDEDGALDFEAHDDVLDIALADDELDTPSARSNELSPIKLRNTTSVGDGESMIEMGDAGVNECQDGGDESLLLDESQNHGSPDEDSHSASKPTVDSDDDDDSPRTRGRFLTERKTEDISKSGGSTSMSGSEGKPITTLGERNPRIPHYPDSRRGGRGGFNNNRQNLGGPRQFGPRGMMMNPNLRHRQPSLLGDRPRPLLRFPNQHYNQMRGDAPVRQLAGGFIDFNQPLRPHGKPGPNTQSPPKPPGVFTGGSPTTGPDQQQQQPQNFNNNKVPGSPQQQQQQQKINPVNKNANIGNRSPNVAPQKRPLAPRVPQSHLRPRIPGAQNPFLSSPNMNQQRPNLRPGGPPHRQHRPNLQQQNLNRPQFPGQQHWRPNSPHNSPQQQLGQQRGMPGIPGVGPPDQEPPFNNNFQPLLGPQPPHGGGPNFGGDNNLVPPGVGAFQHRQPFIPPPSMHQFSSPEEQHLMYRNMPPQQQLQPILQQHQPPNNPNMFMQQPQQYPPPHQDQHPIPPHQQHPNNPFFMVRPNGPNQGDMNRGPPNFNAANQGRNEDYRQFPHGQMPHHLHHQQQQQPDGGWPLPHHQGDMGQVPPPFQQQQSKMHSTQLQFQQQQSPPEHYQQSQNPFLRRGPPDGPLSRNEPRYRESSGDPYDTPSNYHSSSASRSREFSQERYDSSYGDSYRDHDSKTVRSGRGSPRHDGYRDRLPMKRTNDFRDEPSHSGGSPEKRLHGRLGPPVAKHRDDPDPRKDEVIKIIKESQKIMGLDAEYLDKIEEQKRLRDRVLREKEERRKHQQHSGGGGSSGCEDEVHFREVTVENSRREVILHSGGGGESTGGGRKVRPPRNQFPSTQGASSHQVEDQSTTNKSNKSIYVNPKAFNGDLSVLNTNLKMINMNVRSMGGSEEGTVRNGGNTKVTTSTGSSATANFSQNITGMGPTTKKKTILRIVRNKKGEIISKSKVIVLPKQSRDGSSTVSVSTSA